MRAVVYDRYGQPDRLRLTEAALPVLNPEQVLVRVRAVGLNAYDWRMLAAQPFPVRAQQGWLRPKNPILGSDIAGVVESVGHDVTGYQPGDEVFGYSKPNGAGRLSVGGLAEFVAVHSTMLLPKPARLTFEQAAALPMAGVTALTAVRAANIHPGMNVLVNGAAGGVGTYAVQIAKAMGATVTAVCSAAHASIVTQIGAQRVIDYSRQDFTAQGNLYDAVIDVASTHPMREVRRVIKPGGVIASVGFGSLLRLVGVSLASRRQNTPIRVVMVSADIGLLPDLAALVTAGQVTTVVDRAFPLDQAAEAFAYIKQGHAGGKIIVRV